MLQEEIKYGYAFYIALECYNLHYLPITHTLVREFSNSIPLSFLVAIPTTGGDFFRSFTFGLGN